MHEYLVSMMQYQTAEEYAETNNLSHSNVRAQCRKGKIPGAVKSGRNWLIPVDVKSGKKLMPHSTKTFAEIYDCSQMQVRRWIKAKQLKADLVGRDYVIDVRQNISRDMIRKLKKMLARKKKAQKEKKD